MLDPITLSAVSGATLYNGIKKAIMMGREIEDLDHNYPHGCLL